MKSLYTLQEKGLMYNDTTYNNSLFTIKVGSLKDEMYSKCQRNSYSFDVHKWKIYRFPFIWAFKSDFQMGKKIRVKVYYVPVNGKYYTYLK